MKTRAEQEETVRLYYNRGVTEEEQRLAVYPFEFAITMRYITQYLSPGSKILDAACGTGRYAEALLAAGYHVGASDLADANVQHTQRRLNDEPFGSGVLFVRHANALDPDAYDGGPWDGILLLGPFYHLPERQDRVTVLRQARRHLTPQGLLYVSFVSRLAAFWWGLRNWPEGILDHQGVQTLHHTGGPFNFAPPGEGLPNCYFCDPGELEPLFDEVPLSVKHFCGTEGVFGGRVSRLHELDTALREEWFDFTVNHCEAPVFRWTSEHLLIVAQRT